MNPCFDSCSSVDGAPSQPLQCTDACRDTFCNEAGSKCGNVRCGSCKAFWFLADGTPVCESPATPSGMAPGTLRRAIVSLQKQVFNLVKAQEDYRLGRKADGDARVAEVLKANSCLGQNAGRALGMANANMGNMGNMQGLGNANMENAGFAMNGNGMGNGNGVGYNGNGMGNNGNGMGNGMGQ